MFQQVMLKKAISARRRHWSRGTARGWPLARRNANSTPEPRPRHSVRKVNGAMSAIATFIAVQLKPQTTRQPRQHPPKPRRQVLLAAFFH